MKARGALLGPFVLRTLLLLAPCLAVWHYSAPYHAIVAGEVARVMVNIPNPGMVSAIEQSGVDLAFVTTIAVPSASGQTGVLVPDVNPLLYTYGLAFFLALMLAAHARWWTIPAGIAMLLPFQSWGMAFDFLAQVGIKLGPEVAARAGLSGWRVEAIALGYQIGALILPSLMPILFWALLNRPFIMGLWHRHETRHAESIPAPP